MHYDGRVSQLTFVRTREPNVTTPKTVRSIQARVRRIPVVGIVGGIGSGKSAVADWVAANAPVLVLNADRFGHESLEESSVKRALCDRFGPKILGQDGRIVRSELARRVFGADAFHVTARQDLERIVHPEIGRRISAEIANAAAAGLDAVLLDAAVLLEAGWRDKCDLVVFVDSPDSLRLERVLEHRGWDLAELLRRESSQWCLTEKRREADLLIQNDDDLEQAGRSLLTMLEQRGVIIHVPTTGSHVN